MCAGYAIYPCTSEYGKNLLIFAGDVSMVFAEGSHATINGLESEAMKLLLLLLSGGESYMTRRAIASIAINTLAFNHSY